MFRHKRQADLSILADLDQKVVMAIVGTSAGQVLPDLSALLPSLEERRGRLPAPPVVGVAACGSSLLESYPFTGDEFVYADPPYLFKTRRRGRRVYRYEMGSADEHKRLLAIARRLPCPVMISGYWSDLYAQDLADWRSFSFRFMTRGGPSVEWVWCNYPKPKILHDPRYIGADRRRRQDWRRCQSRWLRKFRTLEPARKRALLDILQADLASIS